ncbi:MAG TPA: TolC family outer membrane protein [Brevundimonas sp.]|jgi:outer membrane protein|uniref:TolC family outer membrane protein n=1 Tax=Brevundimonas sp. TaxID=1871086 RepID=UPI002DEF0E2E|nr:TolC family outer membrane protein [Brevundimonas sp.]
MLNRTRALVSAAVLAVAAGLAAPAFAQDNLQNAADLAYRTNPTVLGQRASQRALDESVPQARSGLRPTIDVSASANYSRTDSPSVTTLVDTNMDGIPDTPVTTGGVQESDTGSVSIGLSQTLWSGGRIGLGISVAEANVLAGRENLRGIEQQVLASVIQVYADVLRDEEILRIRESNLTVLQRQLDEANARFEVGEITRTDVAQAEARLAQSQADLANARAQLAVSRAAYAAVVGQAPGTLAPLPQLPGIPADFDGALEVALIENPSIRSALYGLSAAEARVALARAEYLPSVRATASYGGSTSSLGDLGELADNTAFRAGATLSVPIFTGGLNGSRVAQALEQANVAQIAIEGERRDVLQSVSNAYAQLVSARATVLAGEEAVRAATVAAEGVRQEAQVGLRTTLDVLNGELELRNAEVSLATARRNEYVAQANLLLAMGRLDIGVLAPGTEVYDPAANYQRVRNRGALPWEGAIEALDRIAAPPITATPDAPDAPIDQRLKGDVIQTAPGELRPY